MNLKGSATVGGGFPVAILAVVVLSVLLLPLRHALSTTTVMLLFVPLIVVVGRWLGVWPSAVASIVAFLALDFLFIQPYYHLNVATVQEWIGLVVFLAVALISGGQVGVLGVRERVAVGRQRELELLNRLSLHLAAEEAVEGIARAVAAEMAETLGAKRVALYVAAEDTATPSCAAQAGSMRPSSGEAALVTWVLRTGSAIGLAEEARGSAGMAPFSVDAASAISGVVAEGVFIPLATAESAEGVLVVVPADPASFDPRVLVAVANLVAAALERQLLQRRASRAAALTEADRIKTTLVSSVSHELKTPLAAATARVTGLLEDDARFESGPVREELEIVAEDLGRLNSSIGSLLDLSRLESDEWRPSFEPQEIPDVLGTVASRLPADLRARVIFDLAPGLPPARVDFAQIARAIANLVENALQYSGLDAPVIVSAHRKGDAIAVSVEDRGPGVPDAEKPQVFEKFFRGQASSSIPSGTGLGLAIANEIVASHGGMLVVEDAEPVGARFVMTLPIAANAEDR